MDAQGHLHLVLLGEIGLAGELRGELGGPGVVGHLFQMVANEGIPHAGQGHGIGKHPLHRGAGFGASHGADVAAGFIRVGQAVDSAAGHIKVLHALPVGIQIALLAGDFVHQGHQAHALLHIHAVARIKGVFSPACLGINLFPI